jgi:hypothetical protein
MEVVVTGHNFESILPKNNPCHVCFKLADWTEIFFTILAYWFQRRRLNKIISIGSYVKTTVCPLKVAILDGGQGHWTPF